MPRLDTRYMKPTQAHVMELAHKAALRLPRSGNKTRTGHTVCRHLREVLK